MVTVDNIIKSITDRSARHEKDICKHAKYYAKKGLSFNQFVFLISGSKIYNGARYYIGNILSKYGLDGIFNDNKEVENGSR